MHRQIAGGTRRQRLIRSDRRTKNIQKPSPPYMFSHCTLVMPPEKMPRDDTKSLIEDAEIDGALVDWKETRAMFPRTI